MQSLRKEVSGLLWMELVVESPQSQATGSTPDGWVEGEGFWFGLLEV